MKISSIGSIAVHVLLAFFLQNFTFASEELNKIKQAITENNAKWEAADNWVTRLSPEERKRLCGTFRDRSNLQNVHLLNLPKAVELPSQFDWRNNNGNWITPVKNQGSCGSCWAFSALGAIESRWKIKNNNVGSMIDLSEQFLLSCTGIGDCEGGWPFEVFEYVSSEGVPSENCFEYQFSDSIPCSEACANWQDEAVTIPGWGFITTTEINIDNLKNAVYLQPLSADYVVYADFDSYDNGIYEHVWGDETGGHAIVIVGWNEADSCWICKNSWGNYWGESGYFRIKWNECEMGINVPFIWDGLIDSSLVSTSPQVISYSAIEGDTVFTGSIEITNSGNGSLEYAATDYEVPLMFHSNTFNAYNSGASIWCGDPEIGGYENHILQYLDLPPVNLASTSSPQLSWMGYWAIEYPSSPIQPYDGWDGCNVWISTDGGNSFEVLSPVQPPYDCQNLWSFGEPE